MLGLRTGMKTDILPIRRGQQGYARTILEGTVCSLSVDLETGCIGTAAAPPHGAGGWLAIAWCVGHACAGDSWDAALRAPSLGELLVLVLPTCAQVEMAARYVSRAGGSVSQTLRRESACPSRLRGEERRRKPRAASPRLPGRLAEGGEEAEYRPVKLIKCY